MTYFQSVHQLYLSIVYFFKWLVSHTPNFKHDDTKTPDITSSRILLVTNSLNSMQKILRYTQKNFKHFHHHKKRIPIWVDTTRCPNTIWSSPYNLRVAAKVREKMFRLTWTDNTSGQTLWTLALIIFMIDKGCRNFLASFVQNITDSTYYITLLQIFIFRINKWQCESL